MVTKYLFELTNEDDDKIELCRCMASGKLTVTSVDKDLTQFMGTGEQLEMFGKLVEKLVNLLSINGLKKIEVLEEKDV